MRTERRCTRSGFPPSGTIGPVWEDTPAEQPRCEKWWDHDQTEADGECVWEEVYVIPVDRALVADDAHIFRAMYGGDFDALVVEADDD